MASKFDLDSNWKHFTASVHDEVSKCESCPDRPYISLILPQPDDSEVGKTFATRRIVFTTVSHDQGFCDDQSLHGKYVGSHTSFEARVVDPNGCERAPPRHIQANMVARSDFKKHVNCWDYRDSARPDYAWVRETDPSLAEWLQKVQSGDRIQIVPRASFTGWVNFIKEARIDVWVELVHGTSDMCRFSSLGNDYSAYRWLDIGKKEIRLVVIEPASADDDSMRLSIEYTSLAESDHIPFDALSYCWGDGRDPKPVTLLGSDKSQLASHFTVSSNLLAALKRLRHADKRRTFWIDLICINQYDIEERGTQVALMADIYALAKSVWVWLGEVDPDIKEDFKVIRTIAQRYGRSHGQATRESRKPANKHKTHSIIASGNYYTAENDRLFDRPWFKRVWVLQEAWHTPISSSTDEHTMQSRTTVLCGNEELSWDLILQANHCFNTHYPFYSNRVMPAIWSTLFDVTRNPTASRLESTPAARKDILTVVVNGLNMQATDRRDKIFALLGFGEETWDIGKLPDAVRPNYYKSDIEVYADFTRWWIGKHGSLRVLSATHALFGRSWLDIYGSQFWDHGAFDLSQLPSWILWSDGRSEWIAGTLAGQGDCEYRACGDRPLDKTLLKSGGSPERPQLALKGVAISTISSFSQYPCYEGVPRYSEMGRAYRRIFDPAQAAGTWRNSRKSSSTKSALSQSTREYRQGLAAHFWAHANQIDSHAGAWLPCHGKCMFKTASEVVGLCPFSARQDDVVAILYGGNVPYLLRATDTQGEYHFVGECYVEGIMQGEIFSDGVPRQEMVFLLV